MPRAKKAVFRARPNQRKKITLDSETKEELVKCVGIKNDKNSINRMIAFVKSTLIQYYDWLDMFNKPSIGSQIKTIEHVQRATGNLFDEIRDLELSVRILLFSEKFSDVNTEWIKDREALIKIYQRCGTALKYLRPKKNVGRRRSEALRITMQALRRIFYEHRSKSTNQKKNCRYFISEALKAADIAHPDPDEQQSKFDNLLK